MPKPQRICLAKFRRVLSSAIATPGYAAQLQAVGLSAPQCVEALEDAQKRLGWVPLREWRARALDFENPRARMSTGRRFAYPFHPAPNVQLCSSAGALPILNAEETLAAPARVLCEVGNRVARGEIARPRLQHALLAFAGVEEGFLSEDHRELLWRAFRVPIFEQYVDPDGQLMASECEAHEGLHVLPDSAIFEMHDGELFLTSLAALRHPALRLGTGFRAQLDTNVCGCGRAGVRLRDLQWVREPEGSGRDRGLSTQICAIR